MRDFKDESFISQFLSPKIMRDFRFFTVLDDDHNNYLEISAIHNEEGYREIRNKLSAQYNLSNLEPNIQVWNVDLRGDRSLTLRYVPHNRVPLDMVAVKMITEAKAQHPDAKCMLFLLSDGYANNGYSMDEITSALRTSGIPVYTIGYGDDADTGELARLSGINEAASINADSDDIIYKIKSLFNSQL